jgi:hypothetical protein
MECVKSAMMSIDSSQMYVYKDCLLVFQTTHEKRKTTVRNDVNENSLFGFNNLKIACWLTCTY